MTDYSHSPYRRTCELLSAVGLDPTDICIDGFTPVSYRVFATDATGKRLIDYRKGRYMRETRSLPAEVGILTWLRIYGTYLLERFPKFFSGRWF